MPMIRNAAMEQLLRLIAVLWLTCAVCFCDAEPEIQLQVAEMTNVGSVLTKIPQELKWPSTERRDYKILTGKEYMQVGQSTGILKVKKQMDREVLCPDNREHCYVDVTVAVLPVDDTASRSSIKVVKIQIDVTDINDNPPKFDNPIIDKTMSEAVDIGTSIRLDSAVDPDIGLNSIQDYQLITTKGSRSSDKYFELQTISNIDGTKIPKLKLKRRLDRERVGVHELMLEAFDGGTPALTGTATVRINITDSNDNVPIFDHEVYIVKVNEHERKGKEIIQVEAKDKDVGSNGIIVYKFPSIVNAEDREIFELDPDTGAILVKNSEKLDFETKRLHHLTVEATDKGPNAVAAYATITVKVQDVNDNKPQVSVSFVETNSVQEASPGDDYDAIIMEDIDVGKYLAFVTVTDEDGGDNGTVSCSIQENGIFSMESIGENAGRFLLKIDANLDREVKGFYELTIDAWDMGTPPQTDQRVIKLRVGDVNDNPPQFYLEDFEAKVSESASEGAVISGSLEATDLDESPGPNSNITYSLLKSNDSITKNGHKYPLTRIFKIDSVSGEVRLAMGNILDAESVRNPGHLTVLARDNGNPSLNATTKLKITVIDENDNQPAFKQESYIFRIDEHSNNGKYIGQVEATDYDWSKDTNGKITYSIEKPSSADDENDDLWLEMFQVDAKTGYLHFYGNRTKLDREVYNSRPITISVVATDNGRPRRSAHATVQIFLSDINDNKPLVQFPDVRKDISFVRIVTKNSESLPGGVNFASQALRSSSDQMWASVVTIYEAVNVSESVSAPTSLTQVRATDVDEGQNAQLSFAISDGDRDRYFQIDTKDGNLTFSEDTDLELVKLGCHVLRIQVSDLGIPQLHSDAYVNLFLSRDPPEEVNATDAMVECRGNPLFPREDAFVTIAGLEGTTLYIVIGFAVLIFVILLVIAIVLIIKCHCCDGRKKSRSYNCQQRKTWNASLGREGDDRKPSRKRGSSRRSYNGQGTVDSRSSFHSEWTASQSQIHTEKADKVQFLPALPSVASDESRGVHDSGTGDSVSGDAYHPTNYADGPNPQSYITNQDGLYAHPHLGMSQPMQYSSQMVELLPPQQQQMNPYGDHLGMYPRAMISSKCTNECLIYGHGDHCWMPDSLLRAQAQGPVDIMSGGNPDRVIYQNHPGELRYHGDPSTPYYYDPVQKFSHLSSNESSDHLSYTKGHPDEGLPPHPGFQHQPMHAPSPHPHQMRYGNDVERERAYINLQGYDATQNQPEEMHSNLSSASSNANPYGASLPQNNQRYRPDVGHPQNMFYQSPNSSRYGVMSPSDAQDYNMPGVHHDSARPLMYKEDYSASNLLPPVSARPQEYGQYWDHGMAIPSAHHPLVNRSDFSARSGRTSNPNLGGEQERLLGSNVDTPADQQQGQEKAEDEKLSTIQEQDHVAGASEIDGLLL